ncbi:hypothetical protein G6F32_016572 [Rhizopus arrhizus]|nr:hypothetical protein G6F32_016572 [Rhizopus arrhizus]
MSRYCCSRIHPSETGQRLLHNLPSRRRIADVASDGQVVRIVRRLDGPGRPDDTVAAAEKCTGDTLAQALRRAGNDGDFLFVAHDASFCIGVGVTRTVGASHLFENPLFLLNG